MSLDPCLETLQELSKQFKEKGIEGERKIKRNRRREKRKKKLASIPITFDYQYSIPILPRKEVSQQETVGRAGL